MESRDTLLLTRRDVAALLDLDACIVAVEEAFRLHGDGRSPPPGVLGVPAGPGGFHLKAGLHGRYFAAKINANFPDNPRIGLPLIQGVIALCDASDGTPLALMDSIEITIQRTGAATAVAARHLANPGAGTVTIVGCGNQGRIQLRSLAAVLPVTRAFACDVDPGRAAAFARDMAGALGITVHAVSDFELATRQSDVVVTCTPSRRAFLGLEHLRRGAFVAAVGADNDDKGELEPSLLAASRVVVDVLEQCAAIGDLHHAIAAGAMTRADVHAELGEVVAGRKPGRTSDHQIIVFDSTGMALQDVAAAALVYESAVREGRGLSVQLAG